MTMNMRDSGGLSLRSKLLLVTGLVILLVSFVQTLSSYFSLTGDARRALTSEIMSSGELLEQSITHWINDKKALVRAAATSDQLLENTISVLTQAREGGQLMASYLGSSDGKMTIVPDDPMPAGYDPRVRPWYQQAINQQQVIVTDPYVDAVTGKLIISFAAAIPGRKGVFGVDISLEAIVDTILSADFGDRGYAMLINDQGQILVHPDQSLDMKSLPALADSLDTQVMKQLAGSGELASFQDANKTYLAGFRAVSGSKWFIGLVLDERAVMGPIQRSVINAVIYATVIALVTLAVVALLIGRALRPLHDLVQAMSEIAQGEGNLSHKLQIASHDELGHLSKGFNEFSEKIRLLVIDVHQNAGQLKQQAEKLATDASRNASRVQLQQGEIEQVAAAIHEMSAAANEVAGNADATAKEAGSAAEASSSMHQLATSNRDNMSHLTREIEKSTDVIQELNNDAQSIDSILSTIQNIAEQTNLLALNAAIEAARAGEQGRGFAVVADEVRVLSQRTHNSTEEIQQMIEKLQKQAETAVNLMARSRELAGDTLGNTETVTEKLVGINESIQRISDMAVRIAASSSEQHLATEEISRITTAISDAAAEMSMGSKETETTANQLDRLSENLNENLRRFKV
ncbi:methyl-accepting chemotaxis protein [Gynuella sunshinyii]|uniref:Methyl-accepting chemotaxis protein n=1 Tax=Gynuella sunshinyii YC6258 TaxID=1445510 RepID=A0A0C5VR93_9GAMM|nr:methyl-accepting chemotaxis protein [Gynuella sunshinyii]AJQ97167.1 methyl-accepting chemotaxis protein [Gynuella sunshinyii YC6258]